MPSPAEKRFARTPSAQTPPTATPLNTRRTIGRCRYLQEDRASQQEALRRRSGVDADTPPVKPPNERTADASGRNTKSSDGSVLTTSSVEQQRANTRTAGETHRPLHTESADIPATALSAGDPAGQLPETDEASADRAKPSPSESRTDQERSSIATVAQPRLLPAPLQAGVVQGVFAADLRTAAAQLADDIVAEQRRVVICQLDDPPSHTQLLDSLAQELAQAALLLWPDWYGPHVQLSEQSATTRVTTDSNLKALLHAQVRVDATWFRRASLLANRSQRPCVPDTSVTRQVRELASCLRYEDICIIVTVALPAPEQHRLHNILRALEWLARETDAPVVAVTAQNTLPADCQVPFQPLKASETTAAPVEEEFRQRILPFVGRPHPYSPGERQLAAALATDHELTGLFAFNQPVTAASGSQFVVDLLWSRGKVIVEVDGYSNHSQPEMFSSDRHRDYELLISDYAVLRVPHTDVINNVDAVMQKIRQVVRWRSKGDRS